MKYFVLACWILFLILYLSNLTVVPLFEDEAIYLLLAKQISSNPLGHFFIYPQWGLLPVFGWLVGIGGLFFENNFIVGRIINALLASSLIFWFLKIGKLYKFPNSFAIYGSLLILASPILLLNARIALLDTPVLVFTSWLLYFVASYLEKPNFSTLSFIFLFAFLSFLTKFTSLFILPPLFFLLIFNFFQHGKQFRNILNPILTLIVSGLFLGIILVFFGNQISSDSGSSLIGNLNLETIIPRIKNNIWITGHWFRAYYSPFLAIPLISIFLLFKSRRSNFSIIILVWLISTLIFMILFNRFYYPRHLLMMSLPLFSLTAGILSRLSQKITYLILGLIILTQLPLTTRILTNPFSAELAKEDKFEYFENYTSGINIPNISEKLKQLSSREPIVVFLDGSYVMEYGLRQELKKAPIEFKSFRLDHNFLPTELQPVQKNLFRPTYVIVNKWQPLNIQDLKLVDKFPVSFRHTQYLYRIH